MFLTVTYQEINIKMLSIKTDFKIAFFLKRDILGCQILFKRKWGEEPRNGIYDKLSKYNEIIRLIYFASFIVTCV